MFYAKIFQRFKGEPSDQRDRAISKLGYFHGHEQQGLVKPYNCQRIIFTSIEIFRPDGQEAKLSTK